MPVEVLGVERRRRWHDEVKLWIVSALEINGAMVTQVCAGPRGYAPAGLRLASRSGTEGFVVASCWSAVLACPFCAGEGTDCVGGSNASRRSSGRG
jgi:hypothetical protein